MKHCFERTIPALASLRILASAAHTLREVQASPPAVVPLVPEETGRGAAKAAKAVAEAPWSVAEWAVAPRFDHPRATVLVLVLG